MFDCGSCRVFCFLIIPLWCICLELFCLSISISFSVSLSVLEPDKNSCPESPKKLLMAQRHFDVSSFFLFCSTGISVMPVLYKFYQHFQATVKFPLSSAVASSHRQFFFRCQNFGNAGNRTRAAGSGRKYPNHCAMLSPVSSF